jgi:hypothetical protein
MLPLAPGGHDVPLREMSTILRISSGDTTTSSEGLLGRAPDSE